MELYKDSDLELVDSHIDKIVDDIEQIRKQMYPRPNDNIVIDTTQTESTTQTTQTIQKQEPLLESVKEIVEITLKFISDKKRKIYGGYSHNAIIKAKNKDDAFYSDEDAPDIDVYSPTPIEDLVELCDILYNKGYTDVIGKEAMHKETYKIFTQGYNAIDLSYVPKNVYDNIPYVEINDIRYTHPYFSMIDLYKMMSEPLFSSWRWSKIFKRLYLLQKYYPFQKMSPELPKAYIHKTNMSGIKKIIENFIKNNESIYLFGDFAYNCLVHESNLSNKLIKSTDIGIYQIVSTNYKIDALKLIREFKNANIKISFNEYYPLWTLTGHSVEITYENEPIVRVYHNMKRCCPTLKIKLNGDDENKENSNDFVQIGSFDYIFLMEMVMSFKQRVMRDQLKKRYHDTIISNLITLRQEYLKKNKLTLLDNSVFQSFIIPCVGKALDPIMEAKKQKELKKEKQSTIFMYKPIREIKTKWIFANTSGNEIHNPKNFKLKTIKNKETNRPNKTKSKSFKK